ncbi:hypothetical protein KAJ26_01745 [bacterium]|nr:hypothetical protein [bacterium]
MRHIIVSVFVIISCLAVNPTTKSIRDSSISYLKEHSQSKIVIDDKTYLFNGFYYPEIWEIDDHEGTIELITKDLLEFEVNDDVGIKALFETFDYFQQFDDLIVFEKNSNMLFCPSTKYYGPTCEAGYYLFRSKCERNTFYTLEMHSEINNDKIYTLRRISFSLRENLLNDDVLGEYNWTKNILKLKDEVPNSEKAKIEKDLREYRASDKKPWDRSDIEMKKINSFIRKEIDGKIYVVLGTYPLTMIKLYNRQFNDYFNEYIYNYDYYIYDNYEYSIMPFKIEYDAKNNNIVMRAYEDFKKVISISFSIDKEKFTSP